MEREIFSKLYEWKDRVNKKPLLLFGARQTGKTWIMTEFAKRAYSNYVYINFEDDELLNGVFERDFDIDRIIQAIEISKGVKITTDTLIILDELQSAKRGVTSLKYFYEKRQQQPIIAAGSLLGLSIHGGDSFPVGKVESLNVYPLSFSEFLVASGNANLNDLLKSKDWGMIAVFHDKLAYLLKLYYFIGGMPEVVRNFIDSGDFQLVRRNQMQILSDYERDFSKHAPLNELPRIRLVWNSILGQLSKENKKFIYGFINKGARAKEFEVAIEWLRNAGLVYRISRVKKGEFPLAAFEDFSSFKLFLSDVGLMGAMGRLPEKVILDGNEIYATAKGAYTEQFALQQMLASRSYMDIHYWSAENSSGEIDFLIQNGDSIVPMEIKSEVNVQSKSLRCFVEANKNLHGIRFSMRNYMEQEWVTNYPLYSIEYIFKS